MTLPYSDLFWSAADGSQIVARLWQAECPRATVLLTHGLGDHSGRFEQTARLFNQAGLTVLAPDLRGHGRSDGQRGYVQDFDQFLDDLDIATDQANTVADGNPVFGYGQSLGGLLVLYHAIRRQPPCRAVVASSPSLKVLVDAPAWKIALGKTVGRVLPRFSLRAGLDLGELSDDPQVATRARSDRYMHGRITAATYFGMLAAGEFCLQNAWQLELPALVMHGARDTITCPSATQQFAAAAPDCQSVCWPEGKHELHLMSDREQYLHLASDWMLEHLPPDY